jgi:hypothetical protein
VGGGGSGCYESKSWRGGERRQHARELVAVASWPSGRRRKTKGWGPHVNEGEGRARPNRPGGQGPRGVGGRAGQPKAKAKAAGPKT